MSLIGIRGEIQEVNSFLREYAQQHAPAILIGNDDFQDISGVLHIRKPMLQALQEVPETCERMNTNLVLIMADDLCDGCEDLIYTLAEECNVLLGLEDGTMEELIAYEL